MRGAVLAVACLSGAFSAPETAAGQTDEKGPDGTPLACNFHFRIRGAEDPTGSSTTCDTYQFNLFLQPFNRDQSTFQISAADLSKPLTYHLRDMPPDEPVVLLKPDKTPLRIVSMRRADRLNFLVGRVPFKAHPPKALLPH
jgi:hypothetical protein